MLRIMNCFVYQDIDPSFFGILYIEKLLVLKGYKSQLLGILISRYHFHSTSMMFEINTRDLLSILRIVHISQALVLQAFLAYCE